DSIDGCGIAICGYILCAPNQSMSIAAVKTFFRVMNSKLFSGLFAAAVCCSAYGQTAAVYENNGTVLAPPAIPPNIDATTFLNRGPLAFNLTKDSTTIPILPPPPPPP